MFRFSPSPVKPVRAYFTLAITAMALGFFTWKPIYRDVSNEAVLFYASHSEHQIDVSEPSGFSYDWLRKAIGGLNSGKRNSQSSKLAEVLGVQQHKLLLDSYINYPKWHAKVGDLCVVQIDGTLLDQSRPNLPEMKVLFQFSIKRGDGRCSLEKLEILTMGQDEKFKHFVSTLSASGPSDVVARNRRTAKLVRYSEAWSQFDKARSHQEFKRAIRSNPNCSYLYYFEGTTALMENDSSSAISNLDKCLKLDPRNSFALINRSASKSLQGDYAGAVYDSNAAVLACPKNFFVHLNQGYDRHTYGNYSGAFQCASIALELNPFNYEGYVNRAVAAEANHNNSMAIQDYTSAIELYPNRSQAYMRRGILFGKLGQFEKSIFDLNKALNFNSEGDISSKDLMSIYHDLSFAYSHMGVELEARKFAELQISLAPANACGYVDRAFSGGAQKITRQGIADIEHAISLNPNWVELYYSLAQAKKKNNNLNGALLACNHYLYQARSDFRSGYMLRALIKKSLGDSEGAKKDIEVAVKY